MAKPDRVEGVQLITDYGAAEKLKAEIERKSARKAKKEKEAS